MIEPQMTGADKIVGPVTSRFSTPSTVPDGDGLVKDIRTSILAWKREGRTRLQVEARAEEAACRDDWKIGRDVVDALVAEAFPEAPPVTPEAPKVEAPDVESQTVAYWAMAFDARAQGGDDPEAARNYLRVLKPPGMSEFDAERIVRHVFYEFTPERAAREVGRIEAGDWSRLKLPPAQFKLRTFAELLVWPEPAWLLEDILEEGVLSCIYGARSSFKSFLLLDWAQSIARGIPWFNYGVPKARPVVLVVAEGEQGVGKRVRALAADRKLADIPLLRVLPHRLALADEAQVREFRDAVRREIDVLGETPGLIGIDTLAKCSIGLDESSARDMGILLDALDGLRREFGAGGVLVHHTGWDRKHERGSTALGDGVDRMIRVDRLPGAELRSSVEVEKAKDAPDDGQLEITLRVVQYGPGPRENSLVISNAKINTKRDGGNSSAKSDRKMEVLRLLLSLSHRGEMAFTAWSKAAALELGIRSETTFMRAVKALEEAYYVRKGKSRTSPYVITEEGKRALEN